MSRRGGFFDEVLAAMAVAGVVAVGLILLVVSFGFALVRVLRAVAPENRLMEPGRVWLNLIPVFNILWLPITVDRIAWSLRNEFAARGLDDPDDSYGRGPGLTSLTALVLTWVPGVGALLGVVSLVYLIAYWVKMNGYARKLKDGRAAARAYVPPAADDW